MKPHSKLVGLVAVRDEADIAIARAHLALSQQGEFRPPASREEVETIVREYGRAFIRPRVTERLTGGEELDDLFAVVINYPDDDLAHCRCHICTRTELEELAAIDDLFADALKQKRFRNGVVVVVDLDGTEDDQPHRYRATMQYRVMV